MVANTPPADVTPSGKLAPGTAQRALLIAAAAALVGAGAGVGITIAVNRGTSPSTSPGAAASTPTQSLPYGYYQSMMSGYGGSMMGGSYGWMMGQGGCRGPPSMPPPTASPSAARPCASTWWRARHQQTIGSRPPAWSIRPSRCLPARR